MQKVGRRKGEQAGIWRARRCRDNGEGEENLNGAVKEEDRDRRLEAVSGSVMAAVIAMEEDGEIERERESVKRRLVRADE